MGTRALIHVKEDNNKTLITVYRQFDGYPSGLGSDIKNILGNKQLVSGFNDPDTQVNGMGCAAAMLVAGLKKKCGNVYIEFANSEGLGEEYTYTLFTLQDKIQLEIEEIGVGIIYSDSLDDFDAHKLEKES